MPIEQPTRQRAGRFRRFVDAVHRFQAGCRYRLHPHASRRGRMTRFDDPVVDRLALGDGVLDASDRSAVRRVIPSMGTRSVDFRFRRKTSVRSAIAPRRVMSKWRSCVATWLTIFSCGLAAPSANPRRKLPCQRPGRDRMPALSKLPCQLWLSERSQSRSLYCTSGSQSRALPLGLSAQSLELRS